MASLPTLSDDGIALTHFIVAADVERAAHFYSDVLGGEIVLAVEPTIVALANSWIIINVGGGPTDDKPNVILEPPQNPDRVSSFLKVCIADIQGSILCCLRWLRCGERTSDVLRECDSPPSCERAAQRSSRRHARRGC